MNNFKNVMIVSKKIYYNYWLFAAVILIFFSITAFNYPYHLYFEDYWEHTASLKELAANPIIPRNPYIYSSTPSPRYTMYLLFWAMVKNVLKLDVFIIMAWSGICNLLIFLTGLYYFIREYFKDKKLPFYMLVVMLFFWGKGFLWSNEYQFRSLIVNLGYPSFFSFAISLWTFFFIVRFLRFYKIEYYIISVLLGYVTFLCHPPTAAFLFLTVIILASIEKETKFKERFLVIFLPFLSAALSFLWPYFSMYKLFFSAMSTNLTQGTTNVVHTPHPLYAYSPIICLGPMLLGLLFIWRFIMQKKNLFILLGFTFCLSIFIISYFFPLPLGSRFIFFVAFYLHLAIAYKFREWELFTLRSLKEAILCKSNFSLLKLFFIVISVYAVIDNLNLTNEYYLSNYVSLIGRRIVFHKSDKPDMINKFSFLKDKVEAYEVVMADPNTSWMLPTFTGKVISLLGGHGNPLIRDEHQRRNDNLAFFDKETSMDVRKDLLLKYNVSYILLNPDFITEQVMADIRDLGSIVTQKNDLVLIRTK